jgi:hypothetical protein
VKRAAILATLLCAFGFSTAAQQTPAPGSGQDPQRGAVQPPTGGTVATGPGRGRPTPPQPQQKQGPDYLAGTWQFTWTGRESPVSTGPRSGTTTFTQKGNTLDIRTEGKSEEGAAFKESGSAEWNDAQKTLTFKEKLASGAELSGVGNWSSPLAIRYESQPARIGQQSVRLRRNYQILSPTSFSIAEEISIDGGPFQRLGNGAFSKK